MAGEGRKTEADYPQVGQVVTANVLWHRDTNQQICLTQKGWIVKDQS
jgi:hypothetical protein